MSIAPANELIVFPGESALRRFQQDAALRDGWVDASKQTTLGRIRQQCSIYSVKAKLLTGNNANAAQQLLLMRRAVQAARGHFSPDGPLGNLSESALVDVLQKLISELASLPEEVELIINWMMQRPPNQKLYQLGVLHKVWRQTLAEENTIDQLDVNTAQLQLLKMDRSSWPPLLRNVDRIIFRDVRWLNPFEELLIGALGEKADVKIYSALPIAHAERVEDRLGQRIRSEIISGHSLAWTAWAEDTGDALVMDDAEILHFEDADRINFSRSAGAYGEIEDLARRICYEIETGTAANQIALVVPDLGSVQDIIPHVFGRFQIPYCFRRGRAVLSSPVVKAFLSLLGFSLRPGRDDLIDLIRNPAILWPEVADREDEVEKLLSMKPSPDLHDIVLPDYVRSLIDRKQLVGGQALDLLRERIVPPEDDFNMAALTTVEETLLGFDSITLSVHELTDLVEELLEDAMIRPPESDEQGVWVIDPYDAAGTHFDCVLFAGLDEGVFPAISNQDALLNDYERGSLRKHLEEQGVHLPKLALSMADVQFEQQSVLFLGVLGMAREKLVLSHQAVDQEGNEKSSGEYYRKLWNIAGWPAKEDPSLSGYDQWRIERMGDESVFEHHWENQKKSDGEDRAPMPGESFLPLVPLPLCRAQDEALQSAVQTKNDQAFDKLPNALLERLVEKLLVEKERSDWLDYSPDERSFSRWCGQIDGLKERVEKWFVKKDELSPTALESLAKCRYVFLLEHIFGLRDPQVADDSPDPMDRGGLLHKILAEIYTQLADGSAGIDSVRHWAVKGSDGWRKRNEPGADAIPLVHFVPARAEEYLQFADNVTERLIAEAEAKGKLLGHPSVWGAEKEKLLAMVRNAVRYDIENAASENRFPALFECKFGLSTDNAGLCLSDGDESIRLKGTIDRIDLVFAETGELEKVQVLDYKSAGRALGKAEEYHDEIHRNLNCQLPVYALAAQQCLFGKFNTPEVNALTEAGYRFYNRDGSKIGSQSKKSLFALDEPDLISGFLATLFENIRKLKAADFAVDPLIEPFRDYQSICRTVAIERKDLD